MVFSVLTHCKVISTTYLPSKNLWTVVELKLPIDELLHKTL